MSRDDSDDESEGQGLLFARQNDVGFVALCDRCGRIHQHSAGNGHRISHCSSSDFWKFGKLYSDYYLAELDHLPGYLSSSEAMTARELIAVAHRIVSSVSGYLDIVGIDPTSPAAVKLASAAHSLRELASVELGKEDPLELLVNDDQTRDEE